MKRLAVLLLALALVLSLFGCAAKPEEKDAVDEFIEEIKESQETFVAFDKELYDMEDPLTICMDLEYVRDPIGGPQVEAVLNEFLTTLEQSGNLSDVEILFVPKHGEDREMMLEQIRDEIEFGGGPDVFIVNCSGTSNGWNIEEEEPLFPFPERAMENGLFLPLDEYMENQTVFADWEKQTQAVLHAGRTEEGQQIIPLAYTMPLQYFRKSEVDIDLTGRTYTWDDMLNNPEISRYARFVADCATPSFDDGVGMTDDGEEYLEYSFGELADFWTGYLSFTEEELLQRVKEILKLHEELWENLDSMSAGIEDYSAHSGTWLGWEMASGLSYQLWDIRHDMPVTMLPIYSDDGGATASILSWAAVNRNTDRPEDAYRVIDLLMRGHVQKNYWLYENYICGRERGIPMYEELLQPDMPFGRGLRWNLTEENYEELCEVRGQITSANFQSALGVELRALMAECLRCAGYGEDGYLLAEENDDFVSVEQSVHETYERLEMILCE